MQAEVRNSKFYLRLSPCSITKHLILKLFFKLRNFSFKITGHLINKIKTKMPLLRLSCTSSGFEKELLK